MTVGAKKRDKDGKKGSDGYLFGPDESTGLFPEAVLLKEVALFPSSEDRRQAVAMLAQAGFGNSEDEETSRLNVGVKKLLSMVEMARQEPEAMAERLTNALMGLGM